MFSIKTILKYGLLGTATGGAVFSWKANEFDFNSIGVMRFGRAALTVLKIASLYKFNLYSGRIYSDAEYAKISSQVHTQAAQMLLDLCKKNRGVYIKVGQHIGALDYIVPPEYVNTLKVLHSHAPSSDIREVFKVLKEEFKREPLEIFESIEEEPIGTASLAQVHRATLKNGTCVAVKVQHPTVLGNSMVDIRTMSILVNFISWAFPDFKFEWLVEETKRNLPLELNFTHEGENAQKVAEIFKYLKWLKIPNIYNEFTSRRVLTMEYAEGQQINDLEFIKKSQINPFEVSEKLSLLYSKMIFIEGFVHSDPHPGNILVRKNRDKVEIVLLDHGLYALLSPEFTINYSKLWLAILNSNLDGIKKQCEKLGIKDMYGLCACMVTGRTWESIQSGLEKINYSKKEKDKFQEEIPKWLPEITEVLGMVNREMLLIFKTNDLLRGIEHSLGTASRRGALFAMWHACIDRVYADRLRICSTHFCKLKVNVSWTWQLFKLSFYYFYLKVTSYSFVHPLRRVFSNV